LELSPARFTIGSSDRRRVQMAYARMVRFTGVTEERMAALEARVSEGDGPPEGVPATGLRVMFDADQGTAVVMQLFDSEEDMAKGAAVFEAMDASDTPGTRSSVDMCEIKVSFDA
jgi:hypothetical protein